MTPPTDTLPPNNSVRIRQRILEAAAQAFLAEGYGATIDTVADLAGVARRTIFNAFGSKEKLFEVALVAAMPGDSFTPYLDADQDVDVGLRAFGRAYMEAVLRPGSIALTRVMQAEALRFPDVVRRMSAVITRQIVMVLADYLQRQVDKGRLPPHPTELAAENFLAAILGHARLRLALGVDHDVERQDAYFEEALATFLYGIKRPRS